VAGNSPKRGTFSYGHGVIDQHLLAHRHIEFVGDERIDQMPG
jgi:hypothetical protein